MDNLQTNIAVVTQQRAKHTKTRYYILAMIFWSRLLITVIVQPFQWLQRQCLMSWESTQLPWVIFSQPLHGPM